MASDEKNPQNQPASEEDSEKLDDQNPSSETTPSWASIKDKFFRFLQDHPILSAAGGVAMMGDLIISSLIKQTEDHQYNMPTSELWGFIRDSILGEDYYRAIWRKWAKGRSSRSVGISRPNLPSILALDTMQKPKNAYATIKEFIGEFRKAAFNPEQAGTPFTDFISHPKWKTKFGFILPEGQISAFIVKGREATKLEKIDNEIWERTKGIYGEPFTQKYYVESMEVKCGMDPTVFIPVVFEEQKLDGMTIGQVYHAVIRRRGVRIGDPCNTLIIKFPTPAESKFTVAERTIDRLLDIASTSNIYFTKFPSCPRDEFLPAVEKFLDEFEAAVKNEPPSATLADFFNTPKIREIFKLPPSRNLYMDFYDGRSYRLLGKVQCSEVPLREFDYFYGNHEYVIHIYDPIEFQVLGQWKTVLRTFKAGAGNIFKREPPTKSIWGDFPTISDSDLLSSLKPFVQPITISDIPALKQIADLNSPAFSGSSVVNLATSIKDFANKYQKSKTKTITGLDSVYTALASVWLAGRFRTLTKNISGIFIHSNPPGFSTPTPDVPTQIAALQGAVSEWIAELMTDLADLQKILFLGFTKSDRIADPTFGQDHRAALLYLRELPEFRLLFTKIMQKIRRKCLSWPFSIFRGFGNTSKPITVFWPSSNSSGSPLTCHTFLPEVIEQAFPDAVIATVEASLQEAFDKSSLYRLPSFVQKYRQIINSNIRSRQQPYFSQSDFRRDLEGILGFTISPISQATPPSRTAYSPYFDLITDQPIGALYSACKAFQANPANPISLNGGGDSDGEEDEIGDEAEEGDFNQNEMQTIEPIPALTTSTRFTGAGVFSSFRNSGPSMGDFFSGIQKLIQDSVASTPSTPPTYVIQRRIERLALCPTLFGTITAAWAWREPIIYTLFSKCMGLIKSFNTIQDEPTSLTPTTIPMPNMTPIISASTASIAAADFSQYMSTPGVPKYARISQPNQTQTPLAMSLPNISIAQSKLLARLKIKLAASYNRILSLHSQLTNVSGSPLHSSISLLTKRVLAAFRHKIKLPSSVPKFTTKGKSNLPLISFVKVYSAHPIGDSSILYPIQRAIRSILIRFKLLKVSPLLASPSPFIDPINFALADITASLKEVSFITNSASFNRMLASPTPTNSGLLIARRIARELPSINEVIRLRHIFSQPSPSAAQIQSINFTQCQRWAWQVLKRDKKNRHTRRLNHRPKSSPATSEAILDVIKSTEKLNFLSKQIVTWTGVNLSQDSSPLFTPPPANSEKFFQQWLHKVSSPTAALSHNYKSSSKIYADIMRLLTNFPTITIPASIPAALRTELTDLAFALQRSQPINILKRPDWKSAAARMLREVKKIANELHHKVPDMPSNRSVRNTLVTLMGWLNSALGVPSGQKRTYFTIYAEKIAFAKQYKLDPFEEGCLRADVDYFSSMQYTVGIYSPGESGDILTDLYWVYVLTNKEVKGPQTKTIQNALLNMVFHKFGLKKVTIPDTYSEIAHLFEEGIKDIARPFFDLINRVKEYINGEKSNPPADLSEKIPSGRQAQLQTVYTLNQKIVDISAEIEKVENSKDESKEQIAALKKEINELEAEFEKQLALLLSDLTGDFFNSKLAEFKALIDSATKNLNFDPKSDIGQFFSGHAIGLCFHRKVSKHINSSIFKSVDDFLRCYPVHHTSTSGQNIRYFAHIAANKVQPSAAYAQNQFTKFKAMATPFISQKLLENATAFQSNPSTTTHLNERVAIIKHKAPREDQKKAVAFEKRALSFKNNCHALFASMSHICPACSPTSPILDNISLCFQAIASTYPADYISRGIPTPPVSDFLTKLKKFLDTLLGTGASIDDSIASRFGSIYPFPITKGAIFLRPSGKIEFTVQRQLPIFSLFFSNFAPVRVGIDLGVRDPATVQAALLKQASGLDPVPATNAATVNEYNGFRLHGGKPILYLDIHSASDRAKQEIKRGLQNYRVHSNFQSASRIIAHYFTPSSLTLWLRYTRLDDTMAKKYKEQNRTIAHTMAKKIVQSTFQSIDWGSSEITSNIDPSPAMTPMTFHVPPQPSILPQMGMALPFVSINCEDLSNYQAPRKSLFSEEDAHWMRGKMVDYCKEKGEPLLIQVNQHPPHYTSLFCPYCYSEGKKGYIVSTSNSSALSALSSMNSALLRFHRPPQSPCVISTSLPLQTGAKITPFILKRITAQFRVSAASFGFVYAGSGDSFYCPACNTVLHRDIVGALNLAKYNAIVWGAAKISAFIARINRGDRSRRHTKKALEEYKFVESLFLNADFIKKSFEDAERAVPPVLVMITDIGLRSKIDGKRPSMHNFWNGISLGLSPLEQQIVKKAIVDFRAHFLPATPIPMRHPSLSQELDNIFQLPATAQLSHLANLWQQLKP